MQKKTVILIVLSALLFMGIPLSSYAEHEPEHRVELTLSIDAPAISSPPSNGKGAAKGCATGAAIGTAIAPGVGTLAGCIVAGIWGWFW